MTAKHPLGKALKDTMITDVPSYGNKLFYSLGFLSMISFVMLIVTGIIMTVYGPNWWLTSNVGGYTRSVHLWATQAFVLFILLHLLVVFFTSGFKKPRRLTWILGVLMMFIVLAETEFGYVLRGDFSSQWRSLQGADFYNGSGLGGFLNPLNYSQVYGVHIVVIPLAIVGLLGLHYLLVRVLGIAKPYRADVQIKTVPANHKLLFARGGVLMALILGLAILLPSPYIKPTTIQNVAQQDPLLFSKTLVSEIDHSSGTATYADNIAPYTYDTKSVYVTGPYEQFLQTKPSGVNNLKLLNSGPEATQNQQIKDVSDYLATDTADYSKLPNNPVSGIVKTLTVMAQAGLYEPILNSNTSLTKFADGTTYTSRFLADTGVLETKATALNITTQQYGMVREAQGRTPGAWWLAPIGVLNHTVLQNDDNGDRDAAIIFGSLLLTMLAFPFIPYLNQLPDKLKVYKLIWREKSERTKK